MDLRQLEYFATVARLGHFTQSAEALHVGQPALSQAIRRLERELGVDLFDRGTHPVSLTSAGRQLLPHAQAAIDAVAAARAEFGYAQGEPRGRVNIGVLGTLGVADRLVADFHRDHPEVEISLHEDVTTRLIELLSIGQLDAVIATRIDPLPHNVAAMTALREPFVVMAAPDWTDRPTVSLADLTGQTVLLPAAGSAVRAIVERMLQNAGIAWKHGPETNNLQRQRYLASRRVGVSIVPESANLSTGPDVALIPLVEDAYREIALMWRTDRRPGNSVKAFLDTSGRSLADVDRRQDPPA